MSIEKLREIIADSQNADMSISARGIAQVNAQIEALKSQLAQLTREVEAWRLFGWELSNRIKLDGTVEVMLGPVDFVLLRAVLAMGKEK
jgi:hypothetical protein